MPPSASCMAAVAVARVAIREPALPRASAGRRFMGREEVRAGFVGRFEGIPDVQYRDGSHFVCGDRGVSEWTLTGTTTGGERLEGWGCDLHGTPRPGVRTEAAMIDYDGRRFRPVEDGRPPALVLSCRVHPVRLGASCTLLKNELVRRRVAPSSAQKAGPDGVRVLWTGQT